MKPITNLGYPMQTWKGFNHPTVGEITDLSCVRGDDGALYSCWKMSWSERFKALFDGRVWIGVLSERQPPITAKVSEKL